MFTSAAKSRNYHRKPYLQRILHTPELDVYINIGEQKINKTQDNANPSEEEWLKIFQNKLMDLHISRTIALQSIGHLKLIISNNQSLLAKINQTINNIIPLWRNQASIIFGIEHYQNQIDEQNEWISQAERVVRKNNHLVQKELKKIDREKLNQSDKERFRVLNQKLQKMLTDLREIEQSARKNTDEINEIILSEEPVKLEE